MRMHLTTWAESTMCIVEKFFFEASEAMVEALLDCSVEELNGSGFDVEATHEFCTNFDIRPREKFDYATIGPEHFVDSLPYVVHTNRELTLMLAGTKPLAAFVGRYPHEIRLFAEDVFDDFVKQGRFVKREYVELGWRDEPRRLRRILYARAGEEWRIDAYILIWLAAEKAGFGELFNRIEGSLLGYEEWQNDAYIEINRKRLQKIEA